MKRKARSISLASPRHRTFSILFCFTLSYLIFNRPFFSHLPCHVMSSALLYFTVLYCIALLRHQTLNHFHSSPLLSFLLFSRPLSAILYLFFLCSTFIWCTSLSLCGIHVISCHVCVRHVSLSILLILPCIHSWAFLSLPFPFYLSPFPFLFTSLRFPFPFLISFLLSHPYLLIFFLLYFFFWICLMCFSFSSRVQRLEPLSPFHVTSPHPDPSHLILHYICILPCVWLLIDAVMQCTALYWTYCTLLQWYEPMVTE